MLKMPKKVLSIAISISMLVSLVMALNVSAIGAGATYTVLEDYESKFGDFAPGGENAGAQCPPVHVFNRGALIWNPTGTNGENIGDTSTFGISGTGLSGISWLIATGSQYNEPGITTNTSVRLTMYAWDPTASATMRLSFNGIFINKNVVDTEAIIVRLGVKNATTSTNLNFGLYQYGAGGDLTTYYGKKATLTGESAYLIDATTGAYTKASLGGANDYFIPTAFDGWVVLPLSYFDLDSNFNMEKVSALRVNTANGGSQTNLYIDEIGTSADINGFIREKGKSDLTVNDYATARPDFMPGGANYAGSGGVISTNVVTNNLLVSWWGQGDVPAGIPTQYIYNKYVASTNLNTEFGAVVAHTYGTMPMAAKLVSAATDSDASAVIPLKNGGGFSTATPIPTNYGNCEAVAIRMGTWTHPGATGINPLYPGVYFDLFEQKTGSADAQNLGEKFVRKSAADLVGTTVYMIDGVTGSVTQKALGTTSADANEQELASCFVPNNFDGWVVLPLSYFAYKSAGSLDTAGNGTLDISKLVGITVGEKYSRVDSHNYIAKIALTQDIFEFLAQNGTFTDYKTDAQMNTLLNQSVVLNNATGSYTETPQYGQVTQAQKTAFANAVTAAVGVRNSNVASLTKITAAYGPLYNAKDAFYAVRTTIDLSSFKNVGDRISKVSTNTTVDGITTAFNHSSAISLEFKKFGNQAISGTDVIGTGTTVAVKNGSTITRTFEVVIYGDTDGSGDVGLGDLTLVRDHILEGTPLQGAYLTAGDLYGEGKVTLNDLVGIMAAVSENGVISQNP